MNKEYKQGYDDGFQKKMADGHPEYSLEQWNYYKIGYSEGYRWRMQVELIQSGVRKKFITERKNG